MAESQTELEDQTTAEETKERLNLEVKIEKPSPCQRHVIVTVSREDIERYRKRAFDDLRGKAAVPGFRPGRAPHKLVQSRFRQEVADQIKGSLLMDSLTQINEEHQLTAISEPSLDMEAVAIPDEGPMTFEFDLEVRPEFDLPNWRGLKLERPVRDYSEQEITKYLHKLLARYGQRISTAGPVEQGHTITANLEVQLDGNRIAVLAGQQIDVRPVLSFQDGRIEGFDAAIIGAAVGEKRTVKAKISPDAANESIRGKEVDVIVEVNDITKVELPELNRTFLDTIGGFADENELRGAVAEELQRQLKYHQQQRVRQQITASLTASADLALPPEMLRRQARRELERAILELQASGFSQEAIRQHANELRQNSVASTERALKEHFILERIAEDEKIDALPNDYDDEIALIAEQQDESPRRIRARLEKKGQMDTLRNQIIERKVINLIEGAAEFREVPFEPKADNIAAVDVALGGGRDDSEIPEAKHGEAAETLPRQEDRR
jgi:trigger factor